MPDFVVFIGEEDQSIVEHVGRFLAQCEEAETNEYLRLRLFPLSLSRTTFTWYTNLPANSIQTWAEMERQFHSLWKTSLRCKQFVKDTSHI